MAPFRNTLAETASDESMLRWILGGVGGVVLVAGAALWRTLESRHAERTKDLTARILALESAYRELKSQYDAIIAQKDKDLSHLRHERTRLLSALTLAEGAVTALIRTAEAREKSPNPGLTKADIQAIVGNPDDTHYAAAVLERMEENARHARP